MQTKLTDQASVAVSLLHCVRGLVDQDEKILCFEIGVKRHYGNSTHLATGRLFS